MLDWVRVVGELLVSWPIMVLLILIMFRSQLGIIFSSFAKGDGSKASIGPLTIELGKLAEEGKSAVSRINQLTIEMAASRALELEITRNMFGGMLPEEQMQQMQAHIDNIRRLTADAHREA